MRYLWPTVTMIPSLSDFPREGYFNGGLFSEAVCVRMDMDLFLNIRANRWSRRMLKKSGKWTRYPSAENTQ